MGMRFGFGPRGFGLDCGPGLFGAAFGGRDRGRGGFDDWSDWGGGGRGRRRRRQLDSAELRLVLLHMIAAEPRHGYDLIRAIEEMSGGAYAPSPGIVYPTLTMLQDMGHIEEVPGEGARKVFRATEEGRAWLAERADEAAALLERLADLGAGSRRAGAQPIGRAVSNLLAALWHRVTREDMDEATLHEIAEVLDDAARRIERLKRERPDA
ncbi:MAG TPA: PadR family transcriptional regulator [Allosphingosinicella sp.]|jgi:DNA-binding PadR family transcriptional regulator